MKINKKTIILAASFAVVLVSLVFVAATDALAAVSYDYKLLERIPGFPVATETAKQFPEYVTAIYKFGIWTVGIAALLMIAIGGFMYMTSAGNTARTGAAKGVITSALAGLAVALFAWLLLFIINPELTSINLASITTSWGGDYDWSTAGLPLASGGGGGTCEPTTRAGSACTVANLNGAFGDNAVKASSICKVESGGDANIVSSVDVCQDGKGFSVGLFQINMVDSATSICNGNGEIFTTGNSKGVCMPGKRDAAGICHQWSCAVKDMAKYNECLNRLKDPATNIAIAKSLSNNGTRWSPTWGANRICRY